MKDKTLLLLSIGILLTQLVNAQFISNIAKSEIDSIVRLVKESKNKETTEDVLYLYDYVDTANIFLKIDYANAYDLNGYDFKKNILNFLNFKPSFLVYCIKDESSLTEISISKGGVFLMPAVSSDLQIFRDISIKVNLGSSSLFYVEGCKYLFVYLGKAVYIFVDNQLIDANEYLKNHYTLDELSDLFNPRY